MLNPFYVNEYKDVRKLHKIETVETRTIIHKSMPTFYEYIVATELEEKPYTAPPTETRKNCDLYFNEETVGEPRTASRGGNILRERVDSEIKVFYNASASQTAIKNEDVLTCYKERQLQFPMLSLLATIIFQYLPLNLKNRGTSTLQVYKALVVV